MGAFTSKSAKVAVDFPGEAKQSDTGPTNSRKRNLLDKGNGRLDSNTEPGKPGDDAIPRDGLSSAPTTGSGANSPMKRTHSAPRFTQPEKRPGDRALAQPPAAKAAARAAKMTKESKPAVAQPRLDGLNEYIIEGPNVTAEQADEYLKDVLGSACTKNLRSAAWVQRVQGIELISSLVQDRSRKEPLALYKACVTVLVRVLQDKVVPVFLPALQLLVDLYSDGFLSQLPSGQPLLPLPLFARQLVLRSGSSNVRAKDESIGAAMQLARSAHVGPSELAPFVLQPLANGKEKSVHAALGRLELLHALVIKFGFGPAQGFGVAAVLPFVLPLCSSASDKTREAAVSLLREAYTANPTMLSYAKASLPEAVPVIERLREKTDGEASPKKETLAQFKQTHEPFVRKQALPGISGTGDVDGATGATTTELAAASRGDFINISNIPKPKKVRATPGVQEINALLQEYGLE